MDNSWHSVNCTHCGKTNWFQEYGDDSDLDYEACKCWECGKLFWMIEDPNDRLAETLEDANDVDGSQMAGGKHLQRKLDQAIKLLREASSYLRGRLSKQVDDFLANYK